MFKQITEDNWLLYAQKHYDNPTFETEKEFWDDIKRFKYLKRLFRKYELTGKLKIRLVVNHIIVLQNVFGTDAAITLLLYKNDIKSDLTTFKQILSRNLLSFYSVFSNYETHP